MSFWHKLSRPIVVLAPMADVTDAPFRKLIAKYSAHTRSDGSVGGPDVMWTEFVSADGLIRATPEGKKKLLADLIFDDSERPIVAQLFSSSPTYMEQAAALCRDLGFDGIDINMGCPDRSIEKQGCGAAMIKDPDQAAAVIAAAKRGAENLPVSVKTRLGYNQDQLEEWLPKLLAAEPAVVTVHARTRKEMSKVPARWERIARAVEIRDTSGSQTLIFGNGDVHSVEDAHEKARATHADGVMLGRAIFGNPWLFHLTKRLPERVAADNNHYYELISVEERLRVMVEHTKLFSELLPHKSFAVMKKHYKAYVHGFAGAVELRTHLMETQSVDQVVTLVDTFLQSRE